MRSYEDHLQKLTSLQGILRKPVFRSSAIIPIFYLPGISTRICYLGYWMIKKNVQRIHTVVTLRSSEGEIIYRSSSLVEEPRAYRIEIADLLFQIGLDEYIDFLGSLEIEFFSIHDMVFPHPAIVVNYYGPTFSSVVHTAQQTDNYGEDPILNLISKTPKSTFKIYATEDCEPFFAFINGYEQANNCSLKMHFINHKNETLTHVILIDELTAYQVSLIHPSNSLNLIDFLDGKVGTAHVVIDLKCAFPPIISGYYQPSLNAIQIAHTYTDISEETLESNSDRIAEYGFHASSLMIPVSIEGDCFTNICLYPNYSPLEFELNIELYSSSGKLLGYAPKVQRKLSPEGGFQAIELKSICLQLNINPNQSLGAKIIAVPLSKSKLPAQIMLALDYGVTIDGLPCNINKDMALYNHRKSQIEHSFHWAPILADQEDSMVWLVNSASDKNYTQEADIAITCYREQDTLTLHRDYRVAANGVTCLRLNEDLELLAFFEGQIGWYTTISANPNVTSYYINKSNSGVIGGNHDFR